MALRRLVLLVLLAAMIPLASPAGLQAGVPSPANSILPRHVTTAPDGGPLALVRVLDIANNPIAGAHVVLDFSDCPEFHPCPTPCANCTADPATRTVAFTTNMLGAYALKLAVGGGNCSRTAVVRVYADDILLGAFTYAAMDQDGDLTVTGNDLGMVAAAAGTDDPRADITGNGIVDDNDLFAMMPHMGASCDPATPVQTRSWGRLKSKYR